MLALTRQSTEFFNVFIVYQLCLFEEMWSIYLAKDHYIFVELNGILSCLLCASISIVLYYWKYFTKSLIKDLKMCKIIVLLFDISVIPILSLSSLSLSLFFFLLSFLVLHINRLKFQLSSFCSMSFSQFICSNIKSLIFIKFRLWKGQWIKSASRLCLFALCRIFSKNIYIWHTKGYVSWDCTKRLNKS